MFYLVHWLALSYWKSVNSNCLVIASDTAVHIILKMHRSLEICNGRIVEDVFHILMDFRLKTTPNVERGRANLIQYSSECFSFASLFLLFGRLIISLLMFFSIESFLYNILKTEHETFKCVHFFWNEPIKQY